MTFLSYAQNYEDVLLFRALNHVKQGFYVDVGAHDPIVDSVTKAFSERGWRGINIEPVEATFRKLQEDRPDDINLQVVVGAWEGDVSFFEVVGTGLSTCDETLAHWQAHEYGAEVREVLMKQCTLDRLCEPYGLHEIHFMKVDVEGAELGVFKGFGLKNVRPWIILVEAINPRDRQLTHHLWEHCILPKSYHYVYFDGINRYYVADEHRELDAAFESPPNLWDDFERLQQHNLRLQIGMLEAVLASANKRCSRGLIELPNWEGVVKSARRSIVLAKLAAKRIPKFVISHAAAFVKVHPGVKAGIDRLLRPFPAFRSRAKEVVRRGTSQPSKSGIDRLTPRAARAYYDLRQEIELAGREEG